MVFVFGKTTLEELGRGLRLLGVPKSVYSLGRERVDRYCLVFEEGLWKSFYNDRGRRIDLTGFSFMTSRLLNMILADPGVRESLPRPYPPEPIDPADPVFAPVREVLERADKVAHHWFLGDLEHDCTCLLYQDGLWLVGYSERGGFDVWFVDDDATRVQERFISCILYDQ